MQWGMVNGCIVTPQRIIKNGQISISGNKIKSIGRPAEAASEVRADIQNLIVLPGLIDCHDHLLGTYTPRVGDRRPYLNWLMWDNDLKSSPIYAERQQIESAELYLMGGFRHLICGVTSVQDHIPHFVQDMFKVDSPIRIIDNFAMAHSIGSFALKWGEGIEVEHELALKKNIPFISHCSEGYDEETKRSVQVLHSKNALSKQTVLIHGIAFSDSDIELLKQNQVNVVWCPVSNLYMFEDTAPIKKLLDNKINVCLGTDSPMSGSINIFEELHIARNYFLKTYGETLPGKTFFDMLTTNASKAMCMPQIGSLVEGNYADLLVIDGDVEDPYESLMQMHYKNIMLVVIGGVPKFADEGFIPLFDQLGISYQKVRVGGYRKIVNGDLLGLLKRIRNSVGFHKELEYLPVEPW